MNHYSKILNKKIELSQFCQFEPEQLDERITELINYYKTHFPKNKKYEVITFGYYIQKNLIGKDIMEFFAIIKNSKVDPFSRQIESNIKIYSERYTMIQFLRNEKRYLNISYLPNNSYQTIKLNYTSDKNKRKILDGFINYIIAKIFYINKNNAYFEIFVRNNTFMDWNNIRYTRYFNRYIDENKEFDKFCYKDILKLNRESLNFKDIKNNLSDKAEWCKIENNKFIEFLKYIFDLNNEKEYIFDEKYLTYFD